MNPKTIHTMWCISLMVIGIATILLAAAKLAAIELPAVAVRILGVVDLVSLPVLVFSTAKKAERKK